MPAQLVRIGRSFPSAAEASQKDPSYIAIGNFDGVHLGHRRLFEKLLQLKAQSSGRVIALSFYPHPSVKLGRIAQIPKITSLRQKLLALSQIGVEQLCLIHFTMAFSRLSTIEFIEQVLIRQLNIAALVIGQDARVGRGGEGTSEIILQALKQRGRACEIVELFDSAGQKVSSRRIRQAISVGQVMAARSLLGRPFALDARVVRGDGRGQSINVPTANLHTSSQVLPAIGVYACRMRLAGHSYMAVTNVGTRPTFGGHAVRAETHVIDAPPEIENYLRYGVRCQVEFIERLRDEQRFDSVLALTKQIAQDIACARRVLASEVAV